MPSPDGDQLVFAALDRLYVTTLPDGTPERLTAFDVVEAQPVWSPDGHWVAFVSWSPEGGHVWKMRADGSGDPVRLTATPGIYQSPAWSPDGGRIVLIQGAARAMHESAGPRPVGASQNIVWVSDEGGDWQMVAPTDGRSAPHFSSDPERIYLYHAEDGLVSIRWDGTDEQAHVQVTGLREDGRAEPVRATVALISPDCLLYTSPSTRD